MKKAIFSPATLKRWCSSVLAAALLISVCFVLPVTASAEDASAADVIGSVKAAADVRDATYGQVVYLEPSTQYKFSYKYSVEVADTDIVGYYTSDTATTSYTKDSSVTDSTYTWKMRTVTFTTVAADTEGIITDENGNIKSFVGIGAYMQQTNGVWVSRPKYSEQDYVFGDFILTKGDDTTNLFADPAMTSKQTAATTVGTWGALNRTNALHIASQRWQSYTDPATGEKPTKSFFLYKVGDKCVWIKTYDKYVSLVQTISLESDTDYVFGYYHSGLSSDYRIIDHAVSDTIVQSSSLKNGMYWTQYTFTTKSSDTGTVSGNIGIQMSNDNKGMLNHYYGGFTLYKASDINETNILKDPALKDVTHGTQRKTWFNGTTGQVWLKERYLPQTGISDEYFKPHNVNENVVGDGMLTIVKASDIGYGRSVNVEATPDAGYWTRSVTVDGAAYDKIDDNNYVFIRMPNDITVNAEFKAILTGDVNDDDVVNVIDLIRMKKYLADSEIEIVMANADTDGTEEIDSVDIAEVQQLILNG